MEEIEFSRWLLEGRLVQGKNVLNWLCYFEGSSKSHRENSISVIFLESPHQVDMKNVVKCYKYFFGYFNALKTHGESILECIIVTICSKNLRSIVYSRQYGRQSYEVILDRSVVIMIHSTFITNKQSLKQTV